MAISDNTKKSLEEIKQQLEKHIYELAGKIGLVLKEVKVWVEDHPHETVSIIIIIVAAPLAVAILSKALAAAGFTTEIAAGSFAARWESLLPVPAAGNLFSTLQKAGASSAGLAAIEAVVGRTATALAFAMTAPGLITAMMEGRQEKKLKAKL